MLSGNSNQVGDGAIEVIERRADAEALCKWLRRTRPLVGLDCETVECDPKKMAPARGPGRIVCWSLAYIPAKPTHYHSVTGNALATRVFLWASTLESMTPWLTDASCPKVWHNGTSYDYHLFENHGIRIRGALFDTLRLSKLRNPSSQVRHDLKALMWWRLGYKLGGYKTLFSRPGKLRTEVLPPVPLNKRTGLERLVRRKVGGCKGVPTIWEPGNEVARVSWAVSNREIIPLDTLRVDYPRLLPLLYDYATLDAKATLELKPLLEYDLSCMPWKWGAV